MARRSKSAVNRIVLALLVLTAAGIALSLSRGSSSGVVRIDVDGHPAQVRPGTTLGKLVAERGLHAKPGALLAVDGAVIRPGAVAGRLLVNGRAAGPSDVLRGGDRVTAVPGRDRREPVVRQVVRMPQGEPADPQFFLARTPGTETIVRGAISHKLVSATFAPDGPAVADRAVALTFDDGPSPAYTPQILAELRRLHVRATFFVIGYLADADPGLVRAEVRAGMTVGNHSYNHPEVPPFDRLPPRLADDEIALGAESLRRAGVRARLFRPPAGGYSSSVVAAARRYGERIVLWSVDPRDWQPGTTAATIAANVLAAVRPGSIVDLHDGGGDRSATVRALPAIVAGIRHRGLRLVAIAP